MSQQTPPSRVAPGDVLAGKYRVERVIGEGGMGVVVAATHLQLDTLVAMKFITQNGGHAVERFLREARSCVRLKSEHVARVSDVGTLENGMPYMVMEYLEGHDLNSLLESGGPLPVGDAVGYVVHALEAVAEAHALGIVHRDLKPHNLFLTTGVGGRPKVKVLDFGISKTLGAELALTRSAEIVGTPTYMAPEQLRSAKDVDTRADIWALGAILYELTTGHLPFEAASLPQLCTMVLSEDPAPPTTHRPDLPRPLSDAILRCLRRTPSERFADAGELATALAPFAPEWASTRAVLDVGASRPSGRVVVPSMRSGQDASSAAWSETELVTTTRPRWKAVTAGALTLALGCAGAGLWYWRSPPHSPVGAGSVTGEAVPALATVAPAASFSSQAAAVASSTTAVASSAASTAAVQAIDPKPSRGPAREATKPPPRPHPSPSAEPAEDPFNSRR